MRSLEQNQNAPPDRLRTNSKLVPGEEVWAWSLAFQLGRIGPDRCCCVRFIQSNVAAKEIALQAASSRLTYHRLVGLGDRPIALVLPQCTILLLQRKD